jgi:hypothetical protein
MPYGISGKRVQSKCPDDKDDGQIPEPALFGKVYVNPVPDGVTAVIVLLLDPTVISTPWYKIMFDIVLPEKVLYHQAQKHHQTRL